MKLGGIIPTAKLVVGCCLICALYLHRFTKELQLDFVEHFSSLPQSSKKAQGGRKMSGDDESSGWQLTESDPGVFTYVFFCSPFLFRQKVVSIHH